MNYDTEKVELIAFNSKNENINIGISWSFNYLKERLLLKLKYLAFIRVSSCIISGEGYYHYHDIEFYRLKDFDTFIKLIDMGMTLLLKLVFIKVVIELVKYMIMELIFQLRLVT